MPLRFFLNCLDFDSHFELLHFFYFPKWRAINIISCNVETMLLSPNMVHLDSGPKMPKMVGIFNACTFARETLHTCHVSIFLAFMNCEHDDTAFISFDILQF